MSDIKGVIVFGPGGCGKSHNAEALRAHFGLSRIDHEWDGKSPLQDGFLVLTNREVSSPAGFRTLAFWEAMAEAGLSPDFIDRPDPAAGGSS